MKYTVMIPLFGHVNWMHTILHALRRNSVCPPKIVIAWSDPRITRPDSWQGREVNWDGGVFPDAQSFFSHHKSWLNDNEAVVVDLTERCLAFRQEYEQREGKPMEDGCDIAFKNNVSLDYVDTEWCVPNWDADFHPGPAWDEPLVKAIESGVGDKAILIPTHVQPTTDRRLSAQQNAWEDSRELIARNRLALYWPEKEVPEQVFFDFCKRWWQSRTIIEQCGERDRAHHVPTMIRTNTVRELRYNYQGPGYDIEFDDRLRSHGFFKLSFCDSFILHKGYSPLEEGQCSLSV